jgi:hypothetical protein
LDYPKLNDNKVIPVVEEKTNVSKLFCFYHKIIPFQQVKKVENIISKRNQQIYLVLKKES